jgi:hypothetical protein
MMDSYRFQPPGNPRSGFCYAGFRSLLNDCIRFIGRGELHYCEIGAGAGETALIAACYDEIGSVTTIDKRMRPAVTQRLKAVAEKVTAIQGLSADAVAGVKGIDILYIDGCHEYQAVAEDLANYTPLILPGGVAAGHDYTQHFPGVCRAVDEWAAGRQVTRYRDGSWGVLL